jgi:hypothetical protein
MPVGVRHQPNRLGLPIVNYATFVAVAKKSGFLDATFKK